MATQIEMTTAPTTPTRKIPLLPRLGLVVEIGHYRVLVRHVPVLETIANLIGNGGRPTLGEVIQVARRQLSEVALVSGIAPEVRRAAKPKAKAKAGAGAGAKAGKAAHAKKPRRS